MCEELPLSHDSHFAAKCLWPLDFTLSWSPCDVPVSSILGFGDHTAHLLHLPVKLSQKNITLLWKRTDLIVYEIPKFNQPKGAHWSTPEQL